MAEENAQNKRQPEKIWLNSAVSSRLLSHENLGEYKEALNELRDVANKVAPEGRLVTFLVPKAEKFRPFDKMAANLAMSKTFYNERALTTDPEIGIELAQVLEHVNAINKIMDKRKLKQKTFASKRNSEYKERQKQKAEREDDK